MNKNSEKMLKRRRLSRSGRIVLLIFMIITPSFFLAMWYFYWGGNKPKAITYMVTMEDGVKLATDVYLPEGEGPFPAILYRTPYGKIGDMGPIGYTDIGIAVVAQDHRGCYDSEGIYTAFGSDGPDARDTVEWMNSQSWFNGIYGTMGGSARGITQYMQVPFLDDVQCQFIQVATPYLFEEAMYQGGAPRKMLAESWLAGVGGGDYYPTIFNYPFNNSTYAQDHQIDPWEWDNVTWPSIHMGGWYDCFGQGIINGYKGYQQLGGEGGQSNAKLIMGPWTHDLSNKVQGELIYPENANSDPNSNRLFEAMFGEKLLNLTSLGNYRELPNVTYYIMGDVTEESDDWNQWATSPDWPVPHTLKEYYLHSNGSLSTSPQSATNSQNFLFDPSNPIETAGGANLMGQNRGPFDQRAVEHGRSDIIQYNLPIFEPLLLSGRISVKLFVTSNCTDTDFTAKLVDIYPDGKKILLNDGILRMRYREGMDKHIMMDGTGTTVYEIIIDLWSSAYLFNSGHQLQLSISSSNYPRFDINPNNGEMVVPYELGMPYNIANNSILVGESYPSALILPIPTNEPSYV